MRKATKKEFVAAGGISTIEEIVELNKKNISTQLGMCIYTEAVKLEDAFIACLDFEKGAGLIPTIIQDIDTKQVLTLAYSNKDFRCVKLLRQVWELISVVLETSFGQRV